jgi:hypothetical protein
LLRPQQSSSSSSAAAAAGAQQPSGREFDKLHVADAALALLLCLRVQGCVSYIMLHMVPPVDLLLSAACALPPLHRQAAWSERETGLVARVEALRRDRAEAAARAAAAEEGHDVAQWQVGFGECDG